MNPKHDVAGPPVASVAPSRLVAATVALAVGLGLGAGAMHWHYTRSANQQLLEYETQAALLASLRKQQVGLQAQADALSGELVVERSTVKGLQGQLAQTQAQLGQARDALAFYEQLLPPGPKGSLSIRAFSLQPAGTTLRYRVLLSRNTASGKPFGGRLQFIAEGTVKGQPASRQLDAAVVANGDASRALDLEFDQFQRLEGFLAMPDDFFPERVTLNVLEGDAVRASTEVTLEVGN